MCLVPKNVSLFGAGKDHNGDLITLFLFIQSSVVKSQPSYAMLWFPKNVSLLGREKQQGIGIGHWLNLLLFHDPYLPVSFSINLNSFRGKSGNQVQVWRSLNLLTRFLLIQSSVVKKSAFIYHDWFPKKCLTFWVREIKDDYTYQNGLADFLLLLSPAITFQSNFIQHFLKIIFNFFIF